ncbi:DUF5998 family protein [Aquipuribacter nitratireducens]|uniref:DUF5998 family protein n=1 Tax=Aquipuribacter nitratireducens TaxID=650104 RepID=A0ABW0GL84_9MICO
MRETRPRGPRRHDGTGPELPAALVRAVERAGYYPAVVADVVRVALAGEEALEHFVHPETTFDEGDEVRRHVTVLVLTPTRLIVAHADDHTEGDGRTTPPGHPEQVPAAATGRTYAMASTEAVPLDRVTAVVVTHVVDRPERYRPGGLPREVTLGVAWGIASRVDLEPAACADPECEADHGYTGSVTGDDLSLRVSADAEGHDAVEEALRFARALSAATSGR